MPVDITDVNTFTDPITAPAGADAADAASVVAPIQKLSNRTRYLFNRVDAYGGLMLTSAATLTVGAAATLLEWDSEQASEGVHVINDLASHAIELGKSGVIELHASITFGGTADTVFTVAAYVNGALSALKATVKSDADASPATFIGISGLLDLDNGDVVDLRVSGTNGTSFDMRAGSSFWVKGV